MTAAERTKILEMLKNGTINVDEAEQLLSAMDAQSAPPAQEAVVLKDARGRKPKKLRITVDASESKSEDGGKSSNAKVNISIPLSLVKALGPIATKSIPKDTMSDLNEQGINIDELLKQVVELSENTDEDMVNIDVNEGDNEKAKVRIYVE